MGAQVVTRPLVSAELTALADLFAGSWSTRHCRCTSFCSTRREFMLGWFGGGNERRFAARAASGDGPMGVLAWRADQAVGWCACGPRSRYAVDTPRTRMIRDRVGEGRGLVWFLPCFRPGRLSRAGDHTRVPPRAAVQLARDAGGVAVKGWAVADSDRPAAAFVGREGVLREVGFRPVAWPSGGRVIMRVDLEGFSAATLTREMSRGSGSVAGATCVATVARGQPPLVAPAASSGQLAEPADPLTGHPGMREARCGARSHGPGVLIGGRNGDGQPVDRHSSRSIRRARRIVPNTRNEHPQRATHPSPWEPQPAGDRAVLKARARAAPGCG